ncbi:MAG: ATP-dependent zinc metalloprotease FtsH [Lachnospiraceae bacterium]|nr:ATP-dependent zinc metalloprotease FtsH [Lachnospiraceae bacterium]
MNTNQKMMRNTWLGLLMFILLAYALTRGFGRNQMTVNISSTQMESLLTSADSGSYAVTITTASDNNSGTVSATDLTSNGRVLSANVTSADRFAEKLETAGVDYEVRKSGSYNLLIATVVPSLISIIMIVFLIRMMSGAAGGQGAKMANFSKSRARLSSNVSVKLDDVAGMVEEKDELKEVIEFLKNPKAFNDMGARIPKGVILVGSPGTGKTLLAKAVAGEARVPFYSISGSDFVEMFVGVGAARVRDMFEEAKKNSPCIIFIDEIDAVARRRGTGLGGSHDEREQTLNQMLVEMDGFEKNQGIIVMAATNRVDILDPAIMRPGRFDRKITVGHPDVVAREAILNVHARNKHIAADVDLHRIAQTTSGYTGADLENLLNEAAIEATMEKKTEIDQKDIEDAFIKTGIGKEKKSKVISERDKKITAYHETGHAIIFHLLKDVGPVHLISIIPTGEGAAGYTMPLPDKDDSHITRGQLKHMMMAAMGGRIAEELICDDITTGASQDIKQVTKIARAMVMQYGMSDQIGMINCDENNGGDDVFLGYDIAHNKTYGEDMLSLIDREVKKLVDECYHDAKEMIEAHRDVLEKSCALLLEKEKLSGEEFAELF